MKAQVPVFTRQVAIVEELGFSGAQAIRDSFCEVGFVALGEYPQCGMLIYENGMPLRTLVRWPNEDIRRRALEAARLDFEESIANAVEKEMRG